MEWFKNFYESIEEFFSHENQDFYKKFISENKGLHRKGDIFKHIRNISCMDNSKNKLKNIYLKIYEYAKEYEKLFLEDSTTTDNIIIGNKYTRLEISALADFWNTQTGVLYDKDENVFITVDINSEYKYNTENTYINNLFNEISENNKTIKYYAFTNGENAQSIYEAKANQRIRDSNGLNNNFIYAFKKLTTNEYEYLGKYICKDRNFEIKSQKFLNKETNKDFEKEFKIIYFNLFKINNLKESEIQEIQKYGELEDVKVFENLIKDQFLPEEEKKALVKIRWNQGQWRKKILNKYEHSCPLTEIVHNDLLIASHIKPYYVCKRNEAIDIDNGIILNALMDKLFDKGLITFNDAGKIIFSEKLEDSDIDKIQKHIKYWELKFYNSKMNQYMEYHRKNIFKNN